MLDLELLKTLVCVIDEGSFTRAAERVHRTQSTVSQQISKLEQSVGQALVVRDRTGKDIVATEQGELLCIYARRLLSIAQEAEDVLTSPADAGPVRVGLSEDFDAQRMTAMLSGFVAQHPGARLETISGLSIDLLRLLEAGDLDLALVKREPGSGDCIAAWPEALAWVASAKATLPMDDVPLALFPQGCIYRQRAVRSLDKLGKRWRVAFGSHNLTGIQAAVASGLAVSVLPSSAVLAEHQVLTEAQGFPALPPTELALVAATTPLSSAQRGFCDYLIASLNGHLA